ncbi:LysR family transcriptional regulator [Candidatus Formimonas warabiya]|uniref:HTH lysR-type domain-containing protein n=1 Tax=Formimonas warabiya TaxID=1761012 RepID=A0A3G1KYF0_FORW1|nr:LysR family transcriptional regulator [Candidatus Formimonas warabiya]ATW27417.1 hypothetical protein DCMF_24055 [Candidatus Formimonas warabiya]
MELRDLNTFKVIAETKKFRHASEILNYTQPTLTARIKNLEDELGIALLDRTSQGVNLTKAGELFLPYVQKIIKTAEEATDALILLKNDLTTNLLIGASFFVSCYELPSLLSTFRKHYPQICLHVRTARSTEIVPMVERNEIQLAIARGVVASASLEKIKLSEEPIVLCTHPSHPLSTLTRISLQDIGSIPLIAYQRGRGYWVVVEKAFENFSLKPVIMMELDSIEAIKKMIMQTVGASLLPYAAVQEEIAQKQIHALNIVNPGLTRDTYLYSGPLNKISKPTKAFVEMVKMIYCEPDKTSFNPE